jgi:hypothetical protein
MVKSHAPHHSIPMKLCCSIFILSMSASIYLLRVAAQSERRINEAARPRDVALEILRGADGMRRAPSRRRRDSHQDARPLSTAYRILLSTVLQ